MKSGAILRRFDDGDCRLCGGFGDPVAVFVFLTCRCRDTGWVRQLTGIILMGIAMTPVSSGMHVGEGIFAAFHHLFVRQQILEHWVEISLVSPMRWLELGLCIMIMVLTFAVSRKLLPSPEKAVAGQKAFFRHIGCRILWPVLMMAVTVGVAFLWSFTGDKAFWLLILAMASLWMIIIRLALAVLHGVIPDNRFSSRLESALAALLWISFLVWFVGLDDAFIRILKSLSIPIGSENLNLYTIAKAVITLGILAVCALWVSNLLESRIMRINSMDLNYRYVLGKILKSVLLLLTILIALPMVGINLTALSVFGGALGVGLGLGLQKIASNYISGFIILSDRSIRPGDRLTINNFTGSVTKITSRFVVLRDGGGSEALIPNDNFVSSTVINESYSGKSLWRSLNVQVAYDTDLPEALAIMVQAAVAQPRVSPSPPPGGYVLGFGDSGINLSVGFWVDDPENGFIGLNSAINLAIWQGFKDAGIEMPYPQREVRILNAHDKGTPSAAHADALPREQGTKS